MPSRLPMALVALACWLSTAHANARLVGGEVAPPLPAWTEFCGRLPAECAVDHTEPEIIILTPETRELIEAVNHYVNRSLTAMLDEKHWGKIDQWDLPSDGYGDCEDYQLLKRKLLVEAGLPRRALRMTIVIDEMEKGHALLTVRTPGEDLILDNRTGAVLGWDQTGYTFVKRESANRVGWEFLDRAASDMVAQQASISPVP